jgi:hypothetical protein
MATLTAWRGAAQRVGTPWLLRGGLPGEGRYSAASLSCQPPTVGRYPGARRAFVAVSKA